MDHTREGLFLTCCSDHLTVLAIVSHFDKVVYVGVVAWCVVHVLSIGHRGDGLGQYWDSWATDPRWPRRPTGEYLSTLIRGAWILVTVESVVTISNEIYQRIITIKTITFAYKINTHFQIRHHLQHETCKVRSNFFFKTVHITLHSISAWVSVSHKKIPNMYIIQDRDQKSSASGQFLNWLVKCSLVRCFNI